MTLMQAPRMAATAPQDSKPAPGFSLAKLKPKLWWLAAGGLVATAVAIGWGGKDGAVDGANALTASAKPALISAAPPAWELSIDGSATAVANTLAPSAQLSAEQRLIGVYQLLRSGSRADALRQVRQLSLDYPNFQLAQLLYADLLAVSANQAIDINAIAPKNSAQAKQLATLVKESELRLQALTEVPVPGTLPSNFVALPPSTRNAIAIDASRSRLYWFKNTAAPDQPVNMVLVKDAYMSVGKAGVDKFVEGDNRTPLGVYFITSILPGDELPDLYGKGALPLNYPNALDILRRKTGSGIWLHGTPSAQYVRAPLASEGCVVLSNPDIARLLADADIKATPVVIAKSLTWVDGKNASQPMAKHNLANSNKPGDANLDGSAGADTANPADFEASFAQWQHNRRTQDFAALRDTYSDKFFRRGKGLSHWWPTIKGEATRQAQQSDITIVSWQDQDQVMVVNYLDQVQTNQVGLKKRQYWRLEGDTWRIFYEGNA